MENFIIGPMTPWGPFATGFVGLFFAAFMIMPDEWRKPTPLILVVFISAAIAKFSASNRKQD